MSSSRTAASAIARWNGCVQAQTRDQDFDFNTVGAYVQAEIEPFESLKIVPAYRVDKISGDFTNKMTGHDYDISDYGLIKRPSSARSTRLGASPVSTPTGAHLPGRYRCSGLWVPPRNPKTLTRRSTRAGKPASSSHLPAGSMTRGLLAPGRHR